MDCACLGPEAKLGSQWPSANKVSPPSSQVRPASLAPRMKPGKTGEDSQEKSPPA